EWGPAVQVHRGALPGHRGRDPGGGRPILERAHCQWRTGGPLRLAEGPLWSVLAGGALGGPPRPGQRRSEEGRPRDGGVHGHEEVRRAEDRGRGARLSMVDGARLRASTSVPLVRGLSLTAGAPLRATTGVPLVRGAEAHRP